ncbi:MAG: hypothetical protein WAV76_12460 [Bacteroidota bacterium]
MGIKKVKLALESLDLLHSSICNFNSEILSSGRNSSELSLIVEAPFSEENPKADLKAYQVGIRI